MKYGLLKDTADWEALKTLYKYDVIYGEPQRFPCYALVHQFKPDANKTTMYTSVQFVYAEDMLGVVIPLHRVGEDGSLRTGDGWLVQPRMWVKYEDKICNVMSICCSQNSPFVTLELQEKGSPVTFKAPSADCTKISYR